MKTRNILGAVLMVMGVMTASVNAQNTNETLRQKYERLATDADAHPDDWQKQYEVAHMLIDKDSELHNQVEAGKYYERIYHIVADVNAAVPDSVFQEAGITLMFNAMNQQDIQNAIFYGDELKRFAKVKNDKESTMPMMASTMGVMLQMAMERPMAAGDLLDEVRKELAQRQFQGVENTEVMQAMIYEQVMHDYREFIKDKLLEVTLDGKPYVIIAEGLWNVEQPFMGWMEEVPDGTVLLCGEDGRVYDDIHGQISFTFNWSEAEKAVVKSPDTNTRLITVTPEQRQQYVEAYKKYLAK